MGSLLDAALFANQQNPSPAARMTQTTGQSITPATYNNVTFQQVDFDTTGGSMAKTSNGNIYIPRTGIYVVTGFVVWDNSAAGGWYWCGIGINGSTSDFIAQDQTESVGGAGWQISPNCAGIARLAAGDYLTLWADTNAGTAQTTYGGSTRFGVAFLGPA